MKDTETPMSEHDDDVRKLMELAGPRREPPDAVRERVHQAVLEAWEQVPIPSPTSTSTMRQRRWLALAASVVFGLGIGYLALVELAVEPPGISGKMVFASGGHSVRGSEEVDAPLLQEGAMLRTSGRGRLFIQLDEHTTLRLDHNTSITLKTSSEIWLHRGRLYADSQGGDNGGGGIRIETPFASVTDVGTQFEVVVDGEMLEVAIREGEVTVALLDNKILTANAQSGVGERLTILGSNDVHRDALATTDPSWSWTHRAREAYDLEANTLYDFLSWA
ncbi:MAG: FecR family protein, partial [Gammaproteobacteria bacterium]|nr:FecR family protein [Gammaproteobacteria bacterium]